MIEFDRKLTPFSTRLLSKQCSFIYTTLKNFLTPTNNQDIFTLALILFIPPFILDYFITSSLCYFFHNLHARFWTTE
ncbi:Gustatory receptor [Aphis craccivora]|uniref:Gustatory receptor n=1 Tax=Aphis craccivora TaxID=307492 RepID=A0A6G0Y3D5_APHCR|nr:Gustatory receptor [Aphis craccivora]